MKTALINGSPKLKNSASLSILTDIKNFLMQERDENKIQSESDIIISEFTWNKPSCSIKDFEDICKCNTIVFSFPLYVDSAPSHLLKILVDFEHYIDEIKKSNDMNQLKDINVYAVVNNGFFEGKQNCLAIETIGHWCKRLGFNMAGGIGIGGGGMLLAIKNVPCGSGPKKTIGIELKKLSNSIKSRQNYGISFIEPNFPAFLYKFMAETQWRKSVKANGLKAKDLGRRLV